MAVSLSALIPRVRDVVAWNPWATQGTASSASSVVAVTDGTDWDEGAIGEFQDDGEQFKVISVASNNLTCFRGWHGTTAATHSSTTTIVRDPQPTFQQIQQALTVAMQMVYPYAYVVGATTITPVAGQVWYDMAATDQELLSARQEWGAAGALQVGRFVERSRRPTDKHFIEFSRDLPTDVVASGVGVRFPQGFYTTSDTVKVRTKRLITGTSDIEDSNNLPVAEAIVTGALSRLLTDAQFGRLYNSVNLQQSMQISTLGAAQAASLYFQQFRMQLEQLRLAHYDLYERGGDS